MAEASPPTDPWAADDASLWWVDSARITVFCEESHPRLPVTELAWNGQARQWWEAPRVLVRSKQPMMQLRSAPTVRPRQLRWRFTCSDPRCRLAPEGSGERVDQVMNVLRLAGVAEVSLRALSSRLA